MNNILPSKEDKNTTTTNVPERFISAWLFSSGVARTQPMPGHSVGTLRLRRTQAPPSFKPLAVRNVEAARGVWGMLPQKTLEFLSFIGRFWGYFRPYRRLELEHFDHAFATNLRARSVRSL